MRRPTISLLALLALVAAAVALRGCSLKQQTVEAPAKPLAQNQNQKAPPTASVRSTEGAAARQGTDDGSAAGASGGTPDEQVESDLAKLPPDLAQQIRDVQAAVARSQGGRTTTGGRPSAQGTGAETPGVSTNDASAPGPVALTTVKPLEEARHDDTGSGGEATTVSPTIAMAATATGAGAPASAVPPASRGTLEDLTRQYEQLATARPADADVARSLRMLYLVGGQDEKSLEAIPGLSPEEQKVWRGLMWAVINTRERAQGATSADHAAQLLDAVDDVRRTLQQQAPLELGEVQFCDRLTGFGNYEIVPARFQHGQIIRLYVEVRNFVSQKRPDGMNRVLLNERLSLEGPDGNQVWQQSYPNIEDVCRQARQDFFLDTKFIIPANVPAGKYALRLTIEDAAAQKSVGARLDLEVVSRAP